MHYTVSDYVLDIVHNSIEAQAKEIGLKFDAKISGATTIVVADNGGGMSAEEVNRALDPFYTDGRKHVGRRVGLGLPFLSQVVEVTGGTMDVESEPGVGTTVRFTFDPRHIDAPPTGDLVACFGACLSFDGDYELVIDRLSATGSYRVVRSEIIDALGGIHDVGARSLLRSFLESAEAECSEHEEKHNGKDEFGRSAQA